jgi:hypothetical protein
MIEDRRVDRDIVEALLLDESLSFREIARQAGCSDWTVRSIARDLAGDDRPMKSSARRRDDGAGLGVWPVLAAVAVLFIGAVWLGTRVIPPSESGPMP